ncbi:Ycf66 family protein [Merismopedia glauca]|uniref:Ycf66 family protein n=1 Tax=Merismopedia glauca CCAP 1448/3 TaxID=1296344 RepID=A0A2T1BX13_9CYAN|nr:Ycf66 family protein [Merismopedia glauca]PSB00464.1 hypothetical protein C7B64_23370 [Merismopedia glauca CCAP 1448/3]
MLAYILALAVGLGSLGLYMSAFFLPEVHRKNDIIWSGVGLFYALVLWVCANRISGGVLLGQIASVSLLGWFGWQTLMLRREALPKEQQTPLPTQAAIQQFLQQQINRFTKGQNPASPNVAGATGNFNFAQLQEVLTSTLDKATAAVEQTIAKFKKTKTPSVTIPKVAVKTPVEKPPVVVTPPVVEAPPVVETPVEVEPAATAVDSVSPPEIETPSVTPVEVEPPVTPVDLVSTPEIETPSVTPVEVEPPVTPVDLVSTPEIETPSVTPVEVEPPVTPVDLVSTPEIETPSVADTLPTQETEFKSPTDEQIEESIQQAEAEFDPNSKAEADNSSNPA